MEKKNVYDLSKRRIGNYLQTYVVSHYSPNAVSGNEKLCLLREDVLL